MIKFIRVYSLSACTCTTPSTLQKSLNEGKSYRLSNVVVWCYQKSKYLSVPKDDCTVEEIDDLGDIADADVPETGTTANGAKVIGCTLDS